MNLLKKRPLALFSLFFLLGSLLTFTVHANGYSHLYVLLPFAFFLLLALPLLLVKRTRQALLLCVLALALLFGFLVQLVHHNRRFRPWEDLDAGIAHTACGAVRSCATGRYTVYTVEIREIDGEPVTLTLLLRTEATETPLAAGTLFSCEISPVSTWDAYRYESGIAGTALALAPPQKSGTVPPSLADRLAAMRAGMSRRLHSGMSEEDAALISALLLGDRAALSARTTADFRRAGLSHLLALSGLHLSILAGYLLEFLHRLRMPRAITFPLLCLLLFGYTALTGFPYSLIRASIMLVICELAALLRLLPDSVTSLFLSLLLINLFAPASAGDIGLWLSFLATLGILTAKELFPKRKRKNLLSWLLEALLFSLALSTLALVFTLLLTAYSFGALSLLSPLSNLLMTPFIHLLLLLGPFALLFPSLLGPVLSAIAAPLRTAVAFFADIPGGYLSVSYPVFLIALLPFSAYLLFLLVRKLPGKGAFLCRLVPASLAVCLLLLGCHLYETYTPALLYSSTYGDEALVLRTDGRTTLILNAKAPESAAALSRTLYSFHIDRIDLLVLPHYHEETAALLDSLDAEIPIRRIAALPASHAEDAYYRRCAEEAASALSIPWEAAAFGSIPTASAALSLRILGDIPLQSTPHTAFFLSATYRGTEIRYLSAGAPAAVSEADLTRFCRDADLIILGAHPGEAGGAPYMSLPENCTVIVGDPETAPEGLFAEYPGAIHESRPIRYRLTP